MDQNQSGFQKFPKGFLFGSATSAHQVEGGNFNSDWYKWEKAGHIKDGETSDPAANSWNKWREDIELLKQTNQNAYRFSIEWSKIEPEEGKFDQGVIDHYRKILQELKKDDIVSMVTLHHFTLPLWLAKKGGILNKQFPYYFARYAEYVISKIGSLANFWTTINEPKVIVLDSFIRGKFPPNEKSYYKAYLARRNLIEAHIQAYKLIKKIDGRIQVGINQNIAAYEPAHDGFLNRIITNLSRYIDTDIFIKPTNRYTDFLGINYYKKFQIQAKKPLSKEAGSLKNDYGWNINQEGLYQLIKENKRWGKPIFITENGVADEHDKIRPEFIRQALENIGKAIQNEVNVRGYFYWSLLDNFEWVAGYTMKFGLFDINRQPRPSAQVYADLIKKHSSD